MTTEAREKMVHYLTVQDILWINQEVTKDTLPFKFAQLEEATFFQYGYGKSENVLGQAGQFLQGFIRLRPFKSGNRATAFVAALAFLNINGYEIELEPGEAGNWAMRVADKELPAKDAIADVARRSEKPVELNPTTRTIVKDLMEKYSEAIETLQD